MVTSKKHTEEEQHAIDNFVPTMVYTTRRKALQELLLKTPRPALWNGSTYTIVSKHIGAGVYEVTGKMENYR